VARAVFVTGVVTKVIGWAVVALGLYLAVRLLLDGHWGWALLIAFILIPFALWGVSLALALINVLLLYPIAAVTGRRRELTEFSNFQVAAVQMLGADRLTLRASKRLLAMFEEPPPPTPGEGPRSGEELIALYEELHREETEALKQQERASSSSIAVDEEPAGAAAEEVEPPRPPELPRGRAFTKGVPPSRKSATRASAVSAKVLVIDDEAPLRLMYRVNLEEEGMEVVEAALSESPDVILLDVMMPGLDGWRVAEQLRENPATRSVPFVFVTPRYAYRDRLRGLELGAVDYIVAPFNPLRTRAAHRGSARVHARRAGRPEAREDRGDKGADGERPRRP